jgi:ribosome-binding protein aMBF1 (putative translation factor)
MKKINKQKWIDSGVLHNKMMKDPEYRRAYEELETEFQIASQMIEARIKQSITQEELAKKVKTGQAVISRLEGANAKPSISLLERVARALNIKFNITIQ